MLKLCFYFSESDTTPDILTVRLGSSISSDGGDTISVTDLYIHPGYDTKTENFDAAIVVLSRRPKTKSFPIKVGAYGSKDSLYFIWERKIKNLFSKLKAITICLKSS